MSLKIKSALFALLVVPSVGFAADADLQDVQNYLSYTNAVSHVSDVNSLVAEKPTAAGAEMKAKDETVDFTTIWTAQPRVFGHEVF